MFKLNGSQTSYPNALGAKAVSNLLLLETPGD